MTVKLIWATPNADEVMGYCARVSNPANQDNPEVGKLLRYCSKHGHWSVFEMASMCVEINTTRDIGRQILRHRSFHFQEFCVTGDTLVTLVDQSGRTKKRAISALYEYQSNPTVSATWMKGVRVYDESSRTFIRSTIKEVFKTGVKPVFKVTLDDGKTLTCTKEHRFFTRAGFSSLGGLQVGDLVAVNGQEAYKSAEWMTAAKARSLRVGGGVAAIAKDAGVSYHTIRKWLKQHKMQFTKKESAVVMGNVWNKGLPPEQQPGYKRLKSEASREKMRAAARYGSDSNLYVDGAAVQRSWRQKIFDWQHKYRYAVLEKYGHKCVSCGATELLEIDHIVPVSQSRELAFDLDNLQALCAPCHKAKSRTERMAAQQTVKWRGIVSIEPAGDQMTYDLEVTHESHNYVANGIVTHNSQRYADASHLGDMVDRECRMQDTKNRQNSLECADEQTTIWWQDQQYRIGKLSVEAYTEALRLGIAKEQARALLPEGLTPSRMYMGGTIRDWIHYIRVRTHPSTQKEHRLIAQQCLQVLRTVAPVTTDAIFEKLDQ
jgi:thymidylate synthase (FAD)